MTALSRLKASDIREHPGIDFVEKIRADYPTEKEIDVVFSRKCTGAMARLFSR